MDKLNMGNFSMNNLSTSNLSKVQASGSPSDIRAEQLPNRNQTPYGCGRHFLSASLFQNRGQSRQETKKIKCFCDKMNLVNLTSEIII